MSEKKPIITVSWGMPSRWTFEIPPIAAFVRKWTSGCAVIVDPFAGESKIGTHRNDLGRGGIDAQEFCMSLAQLQGKADAVLFDPPYSPGQISACYKEIGRKATMVDTQNAVLYSRVRTALALLLKSGGIALSFGWQSSGFGRDWPTLEILLVQHGGAHNDTICVAQRKPKPPLDLELDR
jgi:hypothetical protein